MSRRRAHRSTATLAVALVALASAGCAKGSETTSGAGGSPGAGSVATTQPATATTAKKEELSNQGLKVFMQKNFPEEWDLIDFDTLTLVTFGSYGYTATIPAGSTADQAMGVCKAMQKYTDPINPDAFIRIKVGDTLTVEKGSAKTTCKPVTGGGTATTAK